MTTSTASKNVVADLLSEHAWVPGFQPEGLPRKAKWSFITRNIPTGDASHVEARADHKPRSGDLILAHVEKIAQHTRIQLRNSRRSLLYPGDKIVVAYGNRYAPDQFEAEIPECLDRCHLVAAGGVAAKAIAKHAKLKWPTTIRPEGYCIDSSGEVMNLRRYALNTERTAGLPKKPVIAVLGTSMNSGKTTTAAALVKGLSAAGYRVAAVKATGTGSGNDVWSYADAGAEVTLDFVDVGYPSTYRVPQIEIQACFDRLLAATRADDNVDVTVVEIADGLLHFETSDLVASAAFKRQVKHVVFAAGEAMGALAGVERLNRIGVTPLAITGLLTASGLAASEAETFTGVPVLTKTRLESPQIAKLVL
ncbi:MAG: molybdopterin-guanine dinucleotide biosynthesis protein MobB [Pseudomonadota bacterium]